VICLFNIPPLNIDDDFALAYGVVKGVPGAAGVGVGIVEDGYDKIALINHILIAVKVGVVAAFL